MQIGIDVGATKIESVVLEEDGQERHRSRTACPKDYLTIINTIKEIHKNLEKNSKLTYQLEFVILVYIHLKQDWLRCS